MLLKTESLTKRFGALTALDEVDLSVVANEIHSVIGPNGAGKTTLFNLLMGVYKPSEGRIEFDGQDITGKSVHKRPKLGISRSYQITNVYPSMSVFENLQTAVGLFHGNYYDMFRPLNRQSHIEQRTEALLNRVGLSEKRDITTNNLSHGDMRHLEIGMALAAEPQLLLLDEPTAGMGSRETNETMGFIRELAEEMAVVLIEHNIEGVMEVSDRITVLEQGEVIATNGPDKIRENETVQNAYLGGGTHA